MKHLPLLLIATVTLGCGGGSSSPTSPSAQPSSGPFSGTWSGTYGGAAAVPMTLSLTQNGSTVTGISVITCPLCGDGRSNVNGTANGNVAAVAFTHPGQTTPYLQGITLTISGAAMTAAWPGGNGATITGHLTSGAPPATAAPVPSLPPTAAVQVQIASASCSAFNTRPTFKVGNVVASGTASGPTGSIFLFSIRNAGTSTVSVDCGGWTKSGTVSNNVRCTAPSGVSSINWAVTQEVYWCTSGCDASESDLATKFLRAEITDAPNSSGEASVRRTSDVTVTCP